MLAVWGAGEGKAWCGLELLALFLLSLSCDILKDKPEYPKIHRRRYWEKQRENVVFGWCTAHWPQACGRREVAVAPDAIAGLRPAELVTALAHVAHWISVSQSSWVWEELQKGYNFWVTSGFKSAPAAAVVLASISGGSSAANPALLPCPKRATMLPRCARSSLPAGDDGWGCVWDMAWQWLLPQIWLGCWWRGQQWG